MLPLDQTTLLSLSSGLRSLDDACGAVDWLQEHDVTLADVLTLYLGSAPEFVDGLPQLVLAAYLRQTEPDKHGGPLRGYAVKRWRLVETGEIDPEVFAPAHPSFSWVSNTEMDWAARHRDLKRRVLALFPEVFRERQETVDWLTLVDFFDLEPHKLRGMRGQPWILSKHVATQKLRDTLESRGFLLDQHIYVRQPSGLRAFDFFQRYPIADAIPPEHG